MPVLETALTTTDDSSQEEVIHDGEQKFPLRRSLFPAVPPTLRFFHLEDERDVVPLPMLVRNHLKWKLTNITPSIVRDTVRRSGFKMTRDESKWVAMWGKHMKSAFYCGMNSYQKVNHFPGSFHIGRKDKLHLNISKLRKNSTLDLDFVPQTFLLPLESKAFHRTWKKEGSQHRWIAKPPASSRGTGVFIVSRWSQISQKLTEPLVVQKYIHKPMLINGNKFDLRLYALVTCWDPLKVYVYKQGMVRFATMPYSESVESFENTYVHLTNYSLNKMSEEYSDEQKWTLDEFWAHLQTHHKNVDAADVWSSLVDVIVKTLIAAEAPIMRMAHTYAPSRYSCFELFGFDVLLDAKLKPWLLEVNISPSMRASSKNDTLIKEPLVRDLLNLIGLRLPQMGESARFDPTDYGLERDDVLFMTPSFYRKQLTAAELQKKEIFTCDQLELREGAILENLLPSDLITLVEFEDEVDRADSTNFLRVVPSPDYEHIVPSRYGNKLLNAWESRYGGDSRLKGRGILRDHCRNKAHLLASDTEGRRAATVVEKKRAPQWRSNGVRLNSAGKLRTGGRTAGIGAQRRQVRQLARYDSSDSFVSHDSSYQDDSSQPDDFKDETTRKDSTEVNETAERQTDHATC